MMSAYNIKLKLFCCVVKMSKTLSSQHLFLIYEWVKLINFDNKMHLGNRTSRQQIAARFMFSKNVLHLNYILHFHNLSNNVFHYSLKPFFKDLFGITFDFVIYWIAGWYSLISANLFSCKFAPKSRIIFLHQ